VWLDKVAVRCQFAVGLGQSKGSIESGGVERTERKGSFCLEGSSVCIYVLLLS